MKPIYLCFRLVGSCVLMFWMSILTLGGAVGGPKNFKLQAYYGKHVTATIDYQGGEVAHLAVTGWECGSVKILDSAGNTRRSGKMKYDKDEDACLFDADAFTPQKTETYTIDILHDDKEGSNLGVFEIQTN